MEQIDVDDIVEINFPESLQSGQAESVEVVFRNGDRKVYSGPELPEVLPMLNHWAPPSA